VPTTQTRLPSSSSAALPGQPRGAARANFYRKKVEYLSRAMIITEKFNLAEYLTSSGISRHLVEFKNKEIIFSQGDLCTDIVYIQSGYVKLSVVNGQGKEAVLAVLRPGDFVGEGCLTKNKKRPATATAMGAVSGLRIEKNEIERVLREEKEFAGRFIQYMLTRNAKAEADLVDQLFNSTEKRLARALLILARYGEEGEPETIVAKISQETLAELVGTTRSRVNFFMNKFRKLGFIQYDGTIQVHRSLLNVVLHD
jgi:CRP/FNR family cyclic AMP-dependent transcriptional regulator